MYKHQHLRHHKRLWYNRVHLVLKTPITHQTGNPTKTIWLGLISVQEFVKALIAKVNGEHLRLLVLVVRAEVRATCTVVQLPIAGVVRNCEEALAQAEDQAGLQAKKAVIGIAGELVKGVTNTIKYRRPQPDKALSMLQKWN